MTLQDRIDLLELQLKLNQEHFQERVDYEVTRRLQDPHIKPLSSYAPHVQQAIITAASMLRKVH